MGGELKKLERGVKDAGRIVAKPFEFALDPFDMIDTGGMSNLEDSVKDLGRSIDQDIRGVKQREATKNAGQMQLDAQNKAIDIEKSLMDIFRNETLGARQMNKSILPKYEEMLDPYARQKFRENYLQGRDLKSAGRKYQNFVNEGPESFISNYLGDRSSLSDSSAMLSDLLDNESSYKQDYLVGDEFKNYLDIGTENIMSNKALGNLGAGGTLKDLQDYGTRAAYDFSRESYQDKVGNVLDAIAADQNYLSQAQQAYRDKSSDLSNLTDADLRYMGLSENALINQVGDLESAARFSQGALDRYLDRIAKSTGRIADRESFKGDIQAGSEIGQAQFGGLNSYMDTASDVVDLSASIANLMA